jgi:hypothetical protein
MTSLCGIAMSSAQNVRERLAPLHRKTPPGGLLLVLGCLLLLLLHRLLLRPCL